MGVYIAYLEFPKKGTRIKILILLKIALMQTV